MSSGEENLGQARVVERGRVLNLGSGSKPIEGAVNLDISPSIGADVIHDLNARPWPFADAVFDEVVGYDVLEHLADVVGFMEEVHRICSAGAIIKLTVPHFSCANAWRDPTHVHAFAHGSLAYFTEGHEFSFYSRARFQRVRAHIQFRPTLGGRLIQKLANRWPTKYEDRWCWIFPAWFIYYELRVAKSESSSSAESLPHASVGPDLASAAARRNAL